MDFEAVSSMLLHVIFMLVTNGIFSGMSDRGMGIRLLKSKDDLHTIFESFEEESDEESDIDQDQHEDATAVITSQLRHFVIQVYLSAYSTFQNIFILGPGIHYDSSPVGPVRNHG